MRRTWRWLVSVLLFLLGAPTLAGAQAMEWRLLGHAPENSLLFKAHVGHFADKVKLWSGGRLVITHVPLGQGVDPRTIHEAVRSGQVEMGWTSPDYLVVDDPTNALLGGYPGGMTPEAFMHWMLHGGGQRLWSDFRMGTLDLISLYVGQAPTGVFALSKKQVATETDLLDYRQQVTGAWALILHEKFAGRPVLAGLFDIPTLMADNAVEAASPGGLGTIRQQEYHKLASFVLLPGVQQPSPATELIINKQRWNELSPDLRQIIRDAARDTVFFSWLTLGHDDRTALAAYITSKTKVRQLDPSLILAMERAGQAWIKEKIAAQQQAGNAWAGRINQAYSRYRRIWEAGAVTRPWEP